MVKGFKGIKSRRRFQDLHHNLQVWHWGYSFPSVKLDVSVGRYLRGILAPKPHGSIRLWAISVGTSWSIWHHWDKRMRSWQIKNKEQGGGDRGLGVWPKQRATADSCVRSASERRTRVARRKKSYGDADKMQPMEASTSVQLGGCRRNGQVCALSQKDLASTSSSILKNFSSQNNGKGNKTGYKKVGFKKQQ